MTINKTAQIPDDANTMNIIPIPLFADDASNIEYALFRLHE